MLVKKNGRSKYAAVELQPEGDHYGVTSWFLEDKSPKGKPYEERGGRKPLFHVARGTDSGSQPPFGVAGNEGQSGNDLTLGDSGTTSVPHAPSTGNATRSGSSTSNDVAKPEQAPYDLSADEVFARQDRGAEHGNALEDEILGTNVGRWRHAQRMLASTNDATANKAQATIDAIEAKLSPRDRDRLYGIGEGDGANADLSDYAQAHSDAMAASPEEAAEAMARFLGELGDTQGADPAHWSRRAQVAYAGMHTLRDRIEQEGWDSAAIQKHALAQAAGRFRDPADAELMLRRFLQPRPAALKSKSGDEAPAIEAPKPVEEVSEQDLSPEDQELVQRTRANAEADKDNADLGETMRRESAERGERDADELGLREPVESILAGRSQGRTYFVHDADGLAADVRKRGKPIKRGNVRYGLHTPEGDTYIFTKHANTPAKAVWTAVHEIGHDGWDRFIEANHDVRVGNRTVREQWDKTAEMALQNPTLAAIADQIGEQRRPHNWKDLTPAQRARYRLKMANEAVQELQAALRTGDWGEIKAKYGVDVPKGVREGVKGAIANFVRRMKAILNAIVFKRTGQRNAFTDADVHDLLQSTWEAARRRPGEFNDDVTPFYSEEPADRDVRSFAQAREKAADFVGHSLENMNGLPDATVSRGTLDKMLSEKAASKSASGIEHARAVANLDHLYKIGVLDHSHPDVNGEPTIAAIHRVVAPMLSENGDTLAVLMTVKETTSPKNPNPLYSVEAIDVTKPALLSPDTGVERGTEPSRPPLQAGFIPNVTRMLEDFKRRHEGEDLASEEPQDRADVMGHGASGPAGEIEPEPTMPPRAPGESDLAYGARIIREGRESMLKGMLRQHGIYLLDADGKRIRSIGRGQLRAYMATIQRNQDAAGAQFRHAMKVFDGFSRDANLKAIHQWETGQEVTSAPHRLFFKVMEKAFDQRIEEIRKLSPGAMTSLIEHYFPHIYKDPTRAAKWYASQLAKRPLNGDRSFLKKRVYATLKDAMAAHLEPISTNPVDLFLAKLTQMDKFIAFGKLRGELKDMGWLHAVKAGERPPPGYGCRCRRRFRRSATTYACWRLNAQTFAIAARGVGLVAARQR